MTYNFEKLINVNNLDYDKITKLFDCPVSEVADVLDVLDYEILFSIKSLEQYINSAMDYHYDEDYTIVEAEYASIYKNLNISIAHSTIYDLDGGELILKIENMLDNEVHYIKKTGMGNSYNVDDVELDAGWEEVFPTEVIVTKYLPKQNV